jgi:hypothetical protein
MIEASNMEEKAKKKISDRLKGMVCFAEARREWLKKKENKLPVNQYIRIGGNGFTAISVSNDHPLRGYKNWSVKQLKTVLSHFKKDNGLPSKPNGNPIKGLKEETRLQSRMIQHALNHENRLDGIFDWKLSGLDDKFDEIHFVMDEVSLGDQNYKVPLAVPKNEEPEGIVRCDILAVGIKGKKAHPILIELKGERLQSRLLDQLKNFSELITDHFRGDFENLFKACLGRSVDCSKCYQFFIWPRPKVRIDADKLNKRKNIDVKVFEYQYEQSSNTCTIEPAQ